MAIHQPPFQRVAGSFGNSRLFGLERQFHSGLWTAVVSPDIMTRLAGEVAASPVVRLCLTRELPLPGQAEPDLRGEVFEA